MTNPWYLNPEWWQVILIVVGTGIAWRTFRSGRDAVRLTQRADVLVNAVPISTLPGPFDGATEIKVEFKNFGPTRASDVRLRAWLEFAEISGSAEEQPPTTVMAAGDVQIVALGQVRTFMTKETVVSVRDGGASLHLFAEADYVDVFGSAHRTREESVYRASDGIFVMMSRKAD